jgi:acylphosphatase
MDTLQMRHLPRRARTAADLQYHWRPYPGPNVKPNMLCNRCLVSGRVQGVFYRATAQQRARELGVRGYARNLPDGRVEVLACGEPASVDAFVSWLWTGSSASKVTVVEVAEVPVDALDGHVGFFTA